MHRFEEEDSDFFFQIPQLSETGKDVEYGESSSVNLLLLFQRHLLANIYSNFSSISLPPVSSTAGVGGAVPPRGGGEAPVFGGEEVHQQIQGAFAVLLKYMSMLHHHLLQVLPMASQLVSLDPRHFRVASQILREGPAVTLLPELSVSLILLQLKLPFKFLESKCFPLVGELVRLLDEFNRLVPGACEEDEQDLAWPDTHSKLRTYVGEPRRGVGLAYWAGKALTN